MRGVGELALADIHPGSDLAVHMRGGARISWDPGQVTPKDLAGYEQEWRLQVTARGELTAYRALRRDLDRVLIPRTLDFSDIPADVLDAAHAARLAGQALPREFYQAREAKLAARSGRGSGVGQGRSGGTGIGAGGGGGRSGGTDAGGGRGARPPTGAGAGGGGGRKPPTRSSMADVPEPSRRGGFAHLYEDPVQLPELQISRGRGIADTGYRVGIVHIPSGFMEKTGRGVVVKVQPGKLLSVGGHSVAERVVSRDKPITAWGMSYSERDLWEILNLTLHGVTREPVSTGPRPRRLKRRVVIDGHDSRHAFRITLLENRTRSEFLTAEQFHPISGQDIVTIPAGSPPSGNR